MTQRRSCAASFSVTFVDSVLQNTVEDDVSTPWVVHCPCDLSQRDTNDINVAVGG